MTAGPGEDCVCRVKTTTLYIHTHDGRVVREYSNNTGTVLRDYLWAGDKRLEVYEYGTAQPHFFVTDHLGSTRQVLDATGQVKSKYDYYVYGGTRRAVASLNTKVRYTGKYLDDEPGVNQTYYGKRYLSHDYGSRFTSVDPLTFNDPGWSPYVYARCNPVKNIDPDGEAAFLAPIVIGAAAWAISEFTLGANVANAPTSQGAPVEPGLTIGDQAVGTAIGAGIGVGVGIAGYGLTKVGGKWVSNLLRGSGNEIAEGAGTSITGSGASSAGRVVKEGIYEFEAASGKPYVGESGQVPTRLSQHLNKGKGSPDAIAKANITEVQGGKTAREIAEQRRINELGGVKNLENKRNSIGENRKHLLDGQKKPSEENP